MIRYFVVLIGIIFSRFRLFLVNVLVYGNCNKMNKFDIIMLSIIKSVINLV